MTKLLWASVFAVLLALAWLFLANSERPSVAGETAASSTAQAAAASQPAVILDDPRVDTDSNARVSPEPVSREVATSSAAASVDSERYRIAGHVLDARTREPIAECVVQLAQEGRASDWLATDDDGRFETPALFEGGFVDVRLPTIAINIGGGGVASVEPNRIWIAETADPTQAVNVELFATRDIAITVSVQRDNGEPAPNTMISFSLDPDPALVAGREKRNELTANISAKCDDAGRCTLWISPRNGEVCRLSLIAFATGGVGKSESIEPPLQSMTVTLVLDRGSGLRVRVVDARGAPVTGAKVELMDRTLPSHTFVFAETTDTEGRVVFPELPSGKFDVSASHASSRRSTEQSLELARNENAALEIVLPDSPEGLAVRGLVVDEQNEPLANVDVRVESPRGATNVQSGADGSFEVWMRPSDDLAVEVGSSALADVFEPARGPVAFGTTDFVARRARVVERTRLLIQIVGADTGKPIENASLHMAVRPDASFSSARVNKGWASVNVTDRTGACVLFSAPGYKSVLRPNRELLPPLARPDDITIALEQGFERRLTFVDSETAQPLAGISMTQPSGAVVRADAAGNVFLSAPEWPRAYRVDCDGYFSFEWDPSLVTVWQRVVRVEKMPR